MQVYMTQTGTRYHARTDMPCMEKARGSTTVDLGVAVDGGLRPCLVCDAPPLPDSTEGDRRWLRTIDQWHTSGLFESIWEEAFARRILAKMSEVTADEVEPQAYINSGTDTFKVDFSIPRNNLVLEVDGFAKSGTTPTSVDVERRNRRDAALQAMGYTVLHFTNAQVQDEPKTCTAAIRQAITRSASTSTTTPTPPAETTAVINDAFSSQAPAPAKSKRILVVGISVAGVALAGLITFAITNTQTAPLWVLPETKFDCPRGFDFKANDNDLVHPPDNKPFYARTTPERCYATLGAAEAEGYTLPPKYDGKWSK